MAALLPVTADLGLRKAWAATIDYTPDHLPILGPAAHRRRPGRRHRRRRRRRPRDDVGPGVSRAAADLALDGATDVVDVTDLGLDRFDEHGRSRLAPDPIALPFPDPLRRVSARNHRRRDARGAVVLTELEAHA